MLITDSFVWINFPKTGSTFARESLKGLYRIPWWDLAKKSRMRGRWCQEVLVPEMRPGVGHRYGRLTPHGVVSQIPAHEVGKPVVSCLRNPYHRLSSVYAYGDWRKVDQLPKPESVIRAEFPNFPDLDFKQFVRYVDDQYSRSCLRVGGDYFQLGCQSADFLRFFSNQAQHVGSCICYESWGALEHELGKVTFIAQEKLSEALPSLLERFGYSERDVNFIRRKPRSNSSSRTPEIGEMSDYLKESVLASEWLLSAAHDAIGSKDRIFEGCLESAAPPAIKARNPINEQT